MGSVVTQSSVQVLTLLPISCATLEKLFTLSVHQFLLHKMKIVVSDIY